MWWESHALSPRARQKVLFNSAPQASSGSGAASGIAIGRGTQPRERRMISGAEPSSGPSARSTESSVRVRIGRSWTQNRSAIGASRAIASSSVKAIGSSLALPEVMTRSSPAPASSR